MTRQLSLFEQQQEQAAVVVYNPPNSVARIQCFPDLERDTVWLSQRTIAELLKISVPAINRLIKNFREEHGERADSSINNLLIVAQDGKSRNVDHYDLTVLTFIGFRAHASERVIEFREWVGKKLNEIATNQRYARKQIPVRQTKDYRRCLDSGYTDDQAIERCEVRSGLKEVQKAVNAERQAHGAEGSDYAKLNALDSEIATGKRPSEWRKDLGVDRPADYLSAVDVATLSLVKRIARRRHSESNSHGIVELTRDMTDVREASRDVVECFREVLSHTPLDLPAPKPIQPLLHEVDQ